MCEYVLPKELIGPSAELEYIKNYEYKQLYKAIDKLPKVQRRRIILRYFYDLKLQQIADVEQVSYDSIKESIINALNKLRKMSNDFSI